MESDQRSEWNHGNAVYGIKPQVDTRRGVMISSPKGLMIFNSFGVDDIRMYISPQASYTFNDIPNLRFG